MSEPAREPDYATKADVDVLRAEMNALRSEMNAGFAELRGELRTEIASMEARLTWRLLGGGAALLALFLTLFRLLDLLPAA